MAAFDFELCEISQTIANGNLVYTVFLDRFYYTVKFDVYGSILIFISAQNFERHKLYEAWEKLDCECNKFE